MMAISLVKWCVIYRKQRSREIKACRAPAFNQRPCRTHIWEMLVSFMNECNPTVQTGVRHLNKNNDCNDSPLGRLTSAAGYEWEGKVLVTILT